MLPLLASGDRYGFQDGDPPCGCSAGLFFPVGGSSPDITEGRLGRCRGDGRELTYTRETASHVSLRCDSPEENAHLIEVVPRPLGPVAEAKDRAWVERRR